MIVSDLLTPIRKVLQDKSSTKWSDAELITYVNSALRQLVLVRPDASSKVAPLLLVAGTRQAGPNDCLRIMDIPRNMGADGLTPGAPIEKTDRHILDTYNSLWSSSTGKAYIEHFAIDDRDPKNFLNYPPVSGTAYVELLYSASPTSMTAVTDTIPVDETYEGPLKDWILHLCYEEETESPTSQQRSAKYENSFYNSLGIKTKSDIAVSPHQDDTFKEDKV